MLTLMTFKPFFGTRSPSPFTVKAEALLAMSGLPFQKEFGDVRKAPKGKFPVLKDGMKLIPDSALIQRYLEDEKGVVFDAHLTEEQRATATAFRRLIEDHFYFINAWFRWTDHPQAVRDSYFDMVPGPLRGLAFGIVKKSVMRMLHMQGLGRHSREDLIVFGKEDIAAIAHELGDKTWFLGNERSSIDASVYSALHNLLACELDCPMKQEVQRYNNLSAYVRRFDEEVFND